MQINNWLFSLKAYQALLTVKWFQVLLYNQIILFNIYYFFAHSSNGFKYYYLSVNYDTHFD